jgi:putative Mg2+ transporter-C (MgtC) family protein
MDLWEMILKLVAAVLLGGLIGLERETHGRPAGLRTHILVCMGSALFALCSYSVAGTRFDPGRVTAQIVTGIGFLGAGTIMRQGSAVRGLTTAASIWTVAAIGIAVAIGGKMSYVAVAAALLVVITLNLISHLERSLLVRRDERLLNVTAHSDPAAMCEVFAILARHGAQLRVLAGEESTDGTSRLLRVRIRTGQSFDATSLDRELAADKDVISFNWE